MEKKIRTPEEIDKIFQKAKKSDHGELVKNKVVAVIKQEIKRMEESGKLSADSTKYARAAHLLGLHEEREILDIVHRKVVDLAMSRKEAAQKPRNQNERELQEYLMKPEKLERIEPKLTLIGDEWNLITGRSDLVMRDGNDKITIVELKGTDWDSQKRNDIIELHFEIDKYSNELDELFPKEGWRIILVLPNYSLKLHTCIKHRIARGNVVVFTFIRDGGEYNFAKVDFSDYEKEISELKAEGKVFKQVQWLKKSVDISPTVIKTGYTAGELIPKVRHKRVITTSVPIVKAQMNEVVRNYISQLEALLLAPEIDAPEKLDENLLSKQFQAKTIPLHDEAMQYLMNRYPAVKAYFDRIDIERTSDRDKNGMLGAMLWPGQSRLLPDFELLKSHIDELTRSHENLLGFQEEMLKACESELNRQRDINPSDVEKRAADFSKQIIDDCKFVKLIESKFQTLIELRFNRLRELKRIWPYDAYTNWPLIDYYLTPCKALSSLKMLLEAKLNDDETLKSLVKEVSQLAANGNDISEAIKNYERASPVLLAKTGSEIEQRQYRRLRRFKENSWLKILSEMEKDLTLPADENWITFSDHRRAEEQRRFLEKRNKLIARFLEARKSLDEEVSRDKNFLAMVKKLSDCASSTLRGIWDLVQETKSSKAYQQITEWAKSEPYVAACAKSWHLEMDKMSGEVLLMLCEKTAELAKIEEDIAIAYFETCDIEYRGIETPAGLKWFLENEKRLYECILRRFVIRRTNNPAEQKRPKMTAERTAERKEVEKKPDDKCDKLLIVLLPSLASGYAYRFTDGVRQRVTYLTEEEIALLAPEEKEKLAHNLKTSKWWLALHDANPTDVKMYEFYNRIADDLRRKKIPEPEDVKYYFMDACRKSLKVVQK